MVAITDQTTLTGVYEVEEATAGFRSGTGSWRSEVGIGFGLRGARILAGTASSSGS